MVREEINYHRWIIFHVAFIVHRKVTAQPLAPPSSSNPSSRTTVFAVLVIIFFFIGLLSVYIRHFTYSSSGFFNHRVNNGCSRQGGLDAAVIESFPVFNYSFVKESKIGSGEIECAICLSELEDNETMRLLPICNHLFHVDCIDAWLCSHATCPVCRSNLKTESLEDRAPIRDHVVIDINNYFAGDSVTVKLPRSNSTGHSLGRICGSTERFRIMAVKGHRLKRTRSFDDDLKTGGKEEEEEYHQKGEGSSYTIGSGEKSDPVNLVDRWSLFVSKSNSNSVKSQKTNGGEPSSNDVTVCR